MAMNRSNPAGGLVAGAIFSSRPEPEASRGQPGAERREGRATMRRLAAVVLVSSLAFAACAHDHALDRRDVVQMQNDSPAISVWSAPISNDAVDQRSATRGADDEN